MNILGRVGVEDSECGSPKGSLPAANLDMSSKSPQLPSEGFGKGCNHFSNTLGVCGGLVEQSIPPYPP